MSYVKPTVAQFKARFRELADTPDVTLQMFLDEADGEVGATWADKDRATAVLYLAAHLLTSQGAAGASSGGGGAASAGAIKRRKVGDVETEYFGPSDTVSTGSGKGFQATAYGKRFYDLLRRNFPGVAVA